MICALHCGDATSPSMRSRDDPPDVQRDEPSSPRSAASSSAAGRGCPVDATDRLPAAPCDGHRWGRGRSSRRRPAGGRRSAGVAGRTDRSAAGRDRGRHGATADRCAERTGRPGRSSGPFAPDQRCGVTRGGGSARTPGRLHERSRADGWTRGPGSPARVARPGRRQWPARVQRLHRSTASKVHQEPSLRPDARAPTTLRHRRY